MAVKITKYKGSGDGMKNILKSKEVSMMLKSRCDTIASRCGKGYKAWIVPTAKKRAFARVYARTNEAVKDNSENNTLLKNLF